MTLFHFSGGMLGTSSIILPGNWGRVIEFHGWNHNCAAREMMLEAARLRHKDKPSRLKCCFAFLTLDEAERFRPNGFQAHMLYRVELEKPEEAIFIADTALCSFNGTARPEWADAYWNGVAELSDTRPPHIREILTLSASGHYLIHSFKNTFYDFPFIAIFPGKTV